MLLVTTTLGVYKPWGRTRYGRPEQAEETLPATRLALGLRVFLAIVGASIVAFLIVHLAGGGLHRHGM
ncbi:MAG TPA: hypothetical protein VEK77_05860 [Gemmatimonadales bacterium]|nr:hypothetical protein [Gemmatimonadales bacterium]